MDTWRNVSHVSKFKKKRKEKDKKKKESQKEKERRRQTGSKREGGEEREGERGKEVFRFSLRYTEIEPSVFVRARRKFYPCIASYAWVPKS